RKLETEGLIVLVPHRGAIVKSLNVDDVEEIYALRAEMESLAVNKSADKMTTEDIESLEKLVARMKETSDPEEFVEANIEYHRMLMKHCRWGRLLSFIETLWNGFPQQTPHMLPGQVDLSNKEHDEILMAVKEGNAGKAAELVSKHINRTGHSVIESIRKSKNGQKSLLHQIREG
ncbi:MAG TPA: GntR family transcriptional regulator, partial [Bacillales bacterium]|nr:GntR family transcriptional regulator [Bacillales bacterium]